MREKRVKKRKKKGKVNPNNEVSVSHQPAGDPRTEGGRVKKKRDNKKKIKHWVSGDSGGSKKWRELSGRRVGNSGQRFPVCRTKPRYTINRVGGRMDDSHMLLMALRITRRRKKYINSARRGWL
jgi:hypothetical protein